MRSAMAAVLTVASSCISLRISTSCFANEVDKKASLSYLNE
jgi:hypothetical protein